MTLVIRTIPDPILRQVCPLMTDFSDAQRLGNEMLETCAATQHAVGLAAPQVGVLTRLIVLDVPSHPKMILINPEISNAKGWNIAREGCLSIPGVTVSVGRADTLWLRYQDVEGQHFSMGVKDLLLSRVLQHEADHLDGVLILDKVQDAERRLAHDNLMRAEHDEEEQV